MDGADRVVNRVVMQSGKNAREGPLLSVIDDDEMLRESVPDLLREFGFAALAFSSGQEFLVQQDDSRFRRLASFAVEDLSRSAMVVALKTAVWKSSMSGRPVVGW